MSRIGDWIQEPASDVRIAAEAVKSASHPHHFMAVTKGGRSAIAATSGNEDCHIILRGGSRPNYDQASVASAAAELACSGVTPRLMIDASHANSGKKPENQPSVVADVANQISGGDLLGDIGHHQRLVLGLLAAVGMVGVDHDPWCDAGARKFDCRGIDAGVVVVRRVATAQDDVAILITRCRHDRRVATLRHGQEMVRL